MKQNMIANPMGSLLEMKLANQIMGLADFIHIKIHNIFRIRAVLCYFSQSNVANLQHLQRHSTPLSIKNRRVFGWQIG